MEKAVYIVFSATPYQTGKLIRKLTGSKYNHVSIALDRDLSQMFGFARRYYRTPLYGGFVKESLSRYCIDGKPSSCMICEISVSTAQYAALEHKLSEMYAVKEQYIYNYLSLLATLFSRRIQVRDALLCVEFVADILSQLNVPVVSGKFYTVRTLSKLLEPFAIYTGRMPAPTEYDWDYFAAKPVPHPYLSSLRAILALLPRLRKTDSKTCVTVNSDKTSK